MKVTEKIMTLRAFIRITCRAKRFNFTLLRDLHVLSFPLC
jgi:hypothetical protein